MLRTTLLASTVLLTLSGCARIADSRLNPVNWFERSTQAPVTATGERRPLVPEGRTTVVVEGRPLVQSVTALSVDRTPTGAIVRAIGTAPTQGFFNAQLVSAGQSNGVLTLEFRAQAPAGFQAQGGARSRQISAAYTISSEDLATIRSVRVQSQTNVRTSGR